MGWATKYNYNFFIRHLTFSGSYELKLPEAIEICEPSTRYLSPAWAGASSYPFGSSWFFFRVLGSCFFLVCHGGCPIKAQLRLGPFLFPLFLIVYYASITINYFCVYIYIYIHTHNIYIYYIYIYVYIYMCMYMYVYLYMNICKYVLYLCTGYMDISIYEYKCICILSILMTLLCFYNYAQLPTYITVHYIYITLTLHIQYIYMTLRYITWQT